VKAAGESFTAIANDLPESCVRRERYRFLGDWRSDLDALDWETARSCAKYSKAAPRLAGSHRVLMQYLTALGDLSAGALVSYDASLDELSGALDQTEMFEGAGIDAVAGMCGVLMDAAAGKWRRRQLGSVIERANPHVLALTAALRDVISADYAQLLDGESEAARKFYLGKLRDHRDDEPLASLLVYSKWRDEEDVIEAKRKAAGAYVKVLDRIAKGHQELHDRRRELDSKEARRLVLRHVTVIEDLLADARRVF
jgi:hypothetical protein